VTDEARLACDADSNAWLGYLGHGWLRMNGALATPHTLLRSATQMMRIVSVAAGTPQRALARNLNGKRGTVADEHLSPGPKDVGSLHKLVSFSQPELFEAETKLDAATGVLGLTAFVVSRKSCQ